MGLFGSNTDGKYGLSFRVMSLMLAVRDRLTSPWRLLDEFGIDRGQTVVDYGCGPGSYLRRASELVGPEGQVFAVDTQSLAVRAVNRRIETERLTNVTAVQSTSQKTSIPGETADVVYALDMFHMVIESGAFLRELNRICKRTGVLFIDNGHQTRDEARSKIRSSGSWEIVEETKRYLKCVPARN
jgi:ubiquinone/menaquinone biosynthesis C-methylase UbiE